MSFPCHGCGACCASMGVVLTAPIESIEEKYREDVLDFPYHVDERGWCEKLTEDMKCSVYEDRPKLCRVDDSYRHFKDIMTKEEYYEETVKSCKILMESSLKMSKKEIDQVYNQINKE